MIIMMIVMMVIVIVVYCFRFEYLKSISDAFRCKLSSNNWFYGLSDIEPTDSQKTGNPARLVGEMGVGWGGSSVHKQTLASSYETRVMLEPTS